MGWGGTRQLAACSSDGSTRDARDESAASTAALPDQPSSRSTIPWTAQSDGDVQMWLRRRRMPSCRPRRDSPESSRASPPDQTSSRRWTLSPSPAVTFSLSDTAAAAPGVPTSDVLPTGSPQGEAECAGVAVGSIERSREVGGDMVVMNRCASSSNRSASRRRSSGRVSERHEDKIWWEGVGS